MDAFATAVRDNTSIAAVLRALGRAQVGSNYRFVKREVQLRGLDTAHWKGRQPPPQGFRGAALESLLVAGSSTNRGSLKRRLIREGHLINACNICGLTDWQGAPITLRLDHVNGVRDDNRASNLRLLCPNCDSQTPYYCGRNKPKTQAIPPRGKNPCSCGNWKCASASMCSKCFDVDRPTKAVWPEDAALLAEVRGSSLSAVGRRLGVSANAVKKRLRSPP